MVKEARYMPTMPLKRCRLQLKGKQNTGTEFHNLAIYGKKLLATSVLLTCSTNVHFLQKHTMYRS